MLSDTPKIRKIVLEIATAPLGPRNDMVTW